jgi:DEAD/DEAH box helicase domain-containing protein
VGGEPVRVVEAVTGRVLGSVDASAAHHTVHAGAVYLHQGSTFVVESLDLAEHVALVRRDDPDWTTQARDVTDITVLSERRSTQWGPVRLVLGTVEVTSQVTSFLRREVASGTVLGEEPLDLPSRTLRTTAVWWTLPPELLSRHGVAPQDVPGAAHAAEHAAIGLLPLVATSDRWDVGGVSTALHPDTGLPTIFVHDAHPGGAGFAERGWEAASTWLRATAAAIADCECESGCPSCVQSPKCGNGNSPLDKAAAVRLLAATLAEAPPPSQQDECGTRV